MRALNQEAWPGAWPWGRALNAVCRGGVWGAEQAGPWAWDRIPPYVGGQLEPAYPCLRTWRITGRCPTTPTCCPVLCSHLGQGQCLPSFWGIPRAAHLEVEVSGGREKSCCPPRSWGRGLGKPCPGDKGPQGALARPPARVALLSTGHKPALSPAGPRWQKSPCLGT